MNSSRTFRFPYRSLGLCLPKKRNALGDPIEGRAEGEVSGRYGDEFSLDD
ncbi:MAG: hypothetical protein V4461_07300 [Pseudomonadota bacterium]|tara:strand:- start:4644 stop:4793 length:150 start_codon:yes stop_codon:yes gene_type:complete